MTIIEFEEVFRPLAEPLGLYAPSENADAAKSWAQLSLPDLVRLSPADRLGVIIKNINHGYETGDFELRDWIVCAVIPALQTGVQDEQSRLNIQNILLPDLNAIWVHWADSGSW